MADRPYTCASIEAEQKGKFDTLPQAHQDWVQSAHANFHYRDGVRNPDDSMGTIKITPGELRDLIAMALLMGAREALACAAAAEAAGEEIPNITENEHDEPAKH